MYSSSEPQKKLPLGWGIHEACVKGLLAFNQRINDNFVWIDEVVAEAKKTLKNDGVELLPKTPSSRKTRQRVNRGNQKGNTKGRGERGALRSSNRLSSDDSQNNSTEVQLPKQSVSKNLCIIDEDSENIKEPLAKRVDFHESDDKENSNIVSNPMPTVDCNRLERNDADDKTEGSEPGESKNRRQNPKRKKAIKNDERTMNSSGTSEETGTRRRSSNKRSKTVAAGGRVTRSRTKQVEAVAGEEISSENMEGDVEPAAESCTADESREAENQVNPGITGEIGEFNEMLGTISVQRNEEVMEFSEVFESQSVNPCRAKGVEETKSSEESSMVVETCFVNNADDGIADDDIVFKMNDDEVDEEIVFRTNGDIADEEIVFKMNDDEVDEEIVFRTNDDEVDEEIVFRTNDDEVDEEIVFRTNDDEVDEEIVFRTNDDEVDEEIVFRKNDDEVDEEIVLKASSDTRKGPMLDENRVEKVLDSDISKNAEAALVIEDVRERVVELDMRETTENSGREQMSEVIPEKVLELDMMDTTENADEGADHEEHALENVPEKARESHIWETNENAGIEPTVEKMPEKIHEAETVEAETSVDLEERPAHIQSIENHLSSDATVGLTSRVSLEELVLQPLAISKVKVTGASKSFFLSTVTSDAEASSAVLPDTVSLSEDNKAIINSDKCLETASKLFSPVCSSFTSWEPISSVVDKDNYPATGLSRTAVNSGDPVGSGRCESPSSTLFQSNATWTLTSSATPTKAAFVSPSRIFLKAGKNLCSDVNKCKNIASDSVPLEQRSPTRSCLKSVIENNLAASPACSLTGSSNPTNSGESESADLSDPTISVKTIRTESKFFPTPDSVKQGDQELNDQNERGNTSSPVKRFLSKMKVRIGTLLTSPGPAKSPSSVTSPSLAMSPSVASDHLKLGSASPLKLATDSSTHLEDQTSSGEMEVDENSDDADVTKGQELDPASLELPCEYENNVQPTDCGLLSGQSSKDRRLSNARKSHGRRSSARPRLSAVHRTSACFNAKTKTLGKKKSTLSKKFFSALKRTLSRTPGTSKETAAKRNEDQPEDGTLLQNTPFKKQLLSVAASVGSPQTEVCEQQTYAHNSPAPNEEEMSDDEPVCDTPPKHVSKTRLVLVRASSQKDAQPDVKSDLRSEKPAAQIGAGCSSNEPVTPGCPMSQTPSTKQKRPLGSRIKMLHEKICQSSAFSAKKNQRKMSTGSTTSSTSNASSGIKNGAKKLGPWNAAQRRISLKKTAKNQLGKESLWVDLNESTASYIGIGSSGSAVTTPIHPSSFLNQLSKKPPTNLVASSSFKSFIQHMTPLKLTREEQDEQKRRELEAKTKKLKEAELRKEEQKAKKAEELKRQRECRQQLALKRRQEQEKELEQKREMQKAEDAAKSSSRAVEEKLREERQKLRERRAAEVEQRRKQDEEARQQLILQSEKDREFLEEQQRLKREAEERERQQKIALQRRQDEDRRKQMECDRLAELEFQRKLEETKQREEQEKQRQKEERERRERVERERLELERLRERERQRDLEIERQRDMEKQKLADNSQLTKDKNMQRILEKYSQHVKNNSGNINRGPGISNSTTKFSSATSCMSASRVPDLTGSAIRAAPVASGIYGSSSSSVRTMTATKVSAPLSSTAAAHNSESYELSPVQKKKKNDSYDNYNIDDLNSDESTDDETKPRKEIPQWAQGIQLKTAIISQFTRCQDTDKIFGPTYALDLNEVFKKKKPKFDKRTSSAAWDVPLLPKPSSQRF